MQVDMGELRAAAGAVKMASNCFERFEQRKWSSRTEQRLDVHGIVGGAVYRDVPWALVPWLYWGGLFHVAGHRVCGVGGWQLVLC
jgi:hypothetical protein